MHTQSQTDTRFPLLIQTGADATADAAGTHALTGQGRLATVVRILLGVVFCLSGVNHMVGLISMPPMTGGTALFYEGLRQTGYFFPLLGVVELAGGALLLAGRRVPLALLALGPVVLNLALFHAALAPQGLGVAALVVAATLYLAWRNRAAYGPVLAARAPRVTAPARAAEVILGALFVASGIAGLLGKMPPASTAGAAAMMQGLTASGYFLPALSAIQVAAGGMLISRRYVGLGLVVLAPIIVEIVAYRLFVAAAAPRMLAVAGVMATAHVCLAIAHGRTFASLFSARG